MLMLMTCDAECEKIEQMSRCFFIFPPGMLITRITVDCLNVERSSR